MSRSLTMLALLLAGLLPPLPAQESGRSLLSAARKRYRDARGTEGTERAVVLEDCIRILAMIPERFPDETAAVARANLEMGRHWRRLDRPEKAEELLLGVLEFPGEASPCCKALHQLASLYRKAKKRDEAIKVLRRVVDEFPSQGRSRALALIRLAGLHRDAKEYAAAEELLRQCLKEHGDRWRQSVDALQALVALKLREKQPDEARRILDAHTDALRARFADTRNAARLEGALMKMSSRARLEKIEAGNDRRGEGRTP